jgi:regulator of protease activity HflC (stomatin/prohibitin superfamily)
MKKVLIIAAGLMTLAVAGCGVEVVDAGEAGIKKTFGKVEQEPLSPGFYLYNPFTSDVITMDVRTLRFENQTPTYTKDVQQANISYVINYNLEFSSVVRVYSEVGQNWADVLIPQVINGEMKNVIGRWNAIELVSNRQKASLEIEQGIASKLKQDGVIVTGFELTNIDYNDEFEQAVEKKVVAVQKAEEAKNQTVQIEERAKQTIIAANADAEAMKIKTAALKESQSLVLYEAVKKWNGVLPKIMSGEAGTILNVPEAAVK